MFKLISKRGQAPPHLVRFVAAFEDPAQTKNIVLEACDYSLLHYIEVHRNNGTQIPHKELWKIAIHILLALHFLHSNGIVHLDVKSANILYKKDRDEWLLCDLGCARRVVSGDTLRGRVGTLDNMCREIVTGSSYDEVRALRACVCTFHTSLTTFCNPPAS